MSRRRRGWRAQLKQWHLICLFLIAAGVVGSTVLVGVATFERTYGIVADWMGWATVTGVRQELQPLAGRLDRAFQWQLYEQIRRLQRNADELKERKTLSRGEQERLAELLDQLAEAKAEYQTVKKRATP